MKPTPNRRDFIKTLGVGGAAAVMPKNILSEPAQPNQRKMIMGLAP